MSTDDGYANQSSDDNAHNSTPLSSQLTFPSWADEELAKYEAGSLRSNGQQSINVNRGNNINERKHIKAGKKRMKCEIRKYEQKGGSSSHGQH